MPSNPSLHTLAAQKKKTHEGLDGKGRGGGGQVVRQPVDAEGRRYVQREPSYQHREVRDHSLPKTCMCAGFYAQEETRGEGREERRKRRTRKGAEKAKGGGGG